jgi:hypothetical protein
MYNRFVNTYGIREHLTVELYPLGMRSRLGHFCIQGHWYSRRLWKVVIFTSKWVYDSRPVCGGSRFNRRGGADWAD